MDLTDQRTQAASEADEAHRNRRNRESDRDECHGEIEQESLRESTVSVLMKIKHLDQYIEATNPFGKVCYTMRACHGIAKALLMLFPKVGGRLHSDQPLPNESTIERTRRFLKVKVRRHTQLEPECTDLPTVEWLLVPGQFCVDEKTPSRLRIQGKEVIPPTLLGKTIFVAVSTLNAHQHGFSHGKSHGEAGKPHNDVWQEEIATVKEADIPIVAKILSDNCIIPGGPWSIYGALYGGFAEKTKKGKPSFATMQAELLQSKESISDKASCLTSNLNINQGLRIVYKP